MTDHNHTTSHPPMTDQDALHYLFNGLAEKGWSFLIYDDGGDDMEAVESLGHLVDAVMAVDDLVRVYLQHREGTKAWVALYAQGSPEDLLVDHTWQEPLTEDLHSLWSIFDAPITEKIPETQAYLYISKLDPTIKGVRLYKGIANEHNTEHELVLRSDYEALLARIET